MSRRICFHEESGHLLEVRQGDITREESVAIVNAANRGLMHGGGVAGAISRAGGPSIQSESNEWVSKHGMLNNGDAVLLGSGDLACKHVIHAVGPVWRGNEKGIDDLDLAMAVYNSLRTANGAGLDSISLPAISSGIFGFPKERCARIMVGVALEFCAVAETPKIIRFTNVDSPTVAIFKSEFKYRFGADRQPFTGDITIAQVRELAQKIIQR